MKSLWIDNASWLVPVVGLIGVAATFAVGGAGWGLVGLFSFLVLAILVLANSYRIANRRARLAEQENEALTELVQTSPEATTQDAATEEQVGEPGEATAPARDNEAGTESESDWFTAALVAAFDGDVAKTRTVVDEAVGQANDDEERLRRESFGLALVARAGSALALDELKAKAAAHPNQWLPVRAIAVAYGWLGDFETAAEELHGRAGAFAGEDRAALRVLEAEYWLDGDQSAAALEAADDACTSAETDGTRRGAFKYRARALRQLSRKVESFAAYEQALELNPADTDLRFELAWFYGEERLGELAMLHYRQVIALDSTRHMAMNNYGWELSKGGMQALAYVQYEQAFSAGNALATSNLAAVLAEAGAHDEAKAWLAKGRAMVPTSSRVEQIAGSLERDREAEDAKLKDLLTEGSLQRRALRDMRGNAAVQLPEGTWRLSNGASLELIPTDAEHTAGKASTGETFTFESATGALTVVSTRAYTTRNGFAFWRGESLSLFLLRPDGAGHEHLELVPEVS